ncbi:hypothetical protein [Actinomadura atramentaria]|uniref:hypothetical protein n=1 Tax=Actinomadura atramentaria TaxID=1990 RepID=UPI000380553C|nr:hypothetical protein [Actinomadura atramentaria]
MKVMFQPARLKTKSVKKHYEDTVLNPVDLDANADLLGEEDLRILQELSPAGRAVMWGMTPGKGGVNVSRYEKLERGDYVFFYGDKRLYLGGSISHLFRNAELADRLWGRDDDGRTWECMYSLTDVRGCKIPFSEIRPLLSRIKSDRFFVQNPYVVDGEDAERVADFAGVDIVDSPGFDLADDYASAAAPKQPRLPAVDRDFDRRVDATRRVEQGALKKYLLPGDEGECALCGRILPREVLWAAHIKKRSECTDRERGDMPNIAMLACNLGCDIVYEKGFVAVDDGGAVLVSPLVRHDHLKEHIERYLRGRVVSWWNPERADYFAWHRNHTFKAPPPKGAQ